MLYPYFSAYRDNKWIKMSSADLKPADIVSILPSNKVKEIVNEQTEDD